MAFCIGHWTPEQPSLAYISLTELQIKYTWLLTRGVTRTHMWGHTHFMELCKGSEQMWGARWTSIHVLMCAHVPTKVWNQRKGDCNIYKATQGCACLCATMQRGWTRAQESGGHAYMY